MTFVQDKAVSIELPSSVILKVTDAPDGIRGDSANNMQKPIILETGITVQAPLFIKTGERIKVDTRDGNIWNGHKLAPYSMRESVRSPTTSDFQFRLKANRPFTYVFRTFVFAI